MSPEPSLNAVPAVRAVDVRKRHGAFWALRGVSLELAPGSVTMLIGSNGAGKTTLIRLLASASSRSGGTLAWFGADEPPRERIAMLSHADGHYDDMTALEHLRMAAALLAPRPARPTPEALLERVGLQGRGGSLVRTYSAGMRKRLAFARLLQKDADLVLLDEPYAALDPAGAVLVDGLLDELRAAGRTVVVSTHQIERAARRCDHAIQLTAGRVTWTGPAVDAPARVADGEPG